MVHIRHLLLQQISLLARFIQLCLQLPLFILFLGEGALECQDLLLALHERPLIVFQTSLDILSFLDLTLHLCLRLHQLVLKGLLLLKDSLLPIFEFTDQVVNLTFDSLTNLLLGIELQFGLSELFCYLLFGLAFALSRLMRPGKLFSQADDH